MIDRLSRTTSTRFLHLKCSYTNLLGNVAQSAEQRTVNPWAVGSYPTISAISTYWGSDANIIEYATRRGKRLKRLTHNRKEERALSLNKSRIS